MPSFLLNAMNLTANIYYIICKCFYYFCYNSIYVYSVIQLRVNKYVSYSKLLITNFKDGHAHKHDMANKDQRDPNSSSSSSISINRIEPEYEHFVEYFGNENNLCHEIIYNPNKHSIFKDVLNKAFDKGKDKDNDVNINNRNYFIYNAEINNKKYDRILLYNFDNAVWVNNKIAYELSDHTFMSAQLKFTNDMDNRIYDIKLSNDRYNYYILGNRINKDFVKYYCEQILRIKDTISKLSKDNHNQNNSTLKYSLTIVDGDVNVLTLTEEDELIFGKYAYLLHKYKK